MGPTFVIALNDQAVPSNATDTLVNIKSIIEIPAPANQAIRITGVDLTFDGVPNTTAKPALIQLINASVTGTFPNNTLTPVAENNDGAAESTLVTAANIKYGTASAEGTLVTGNGLRLYRLVPTSGVLYQLPLGRELWVPKGDFFRIRAVMQASSINVTLNVSWEE